MKLDSMRVRYYGITDECLECQHCGRSDLKKTVMLYILDADGNAGELTYFGTSCAARTLGSTAAQVKKEAERAQAYRITRARELRGKLDAPWCATWIGQTFDSEVRRWGGVRLDGVWFTADQRAEYVTAQEASWRKELEYCR